jgi:hypothetical protein
VGESAKEHAVALKEAFRKLPNSHKLGFIGIGISITGLAEMLVSLDAYRNFHLIGRQASMNAVEAGSWIAVGGAALFIPTMFLMVYEQERSIKKHRAQAMEKEKSKKVS